MSPFSFLLPNLLAAAITQQRFQLCFAKQACRITRQQRASLVGLPDPVCSIVFQPLRHALEGLVIHR
ncbi:hypothetical protein D3C79_668220 [compost metagenome]|jgi:hypothetical protein